MPTQTREHVLPITGCDSLCLSGFQGVQPLARSQSVPVGTLGNLAFRFSAIGVEPFCGLEYAPAGVRLVQAAD